MQTFNELLGNTVRLEAEFKDFNDNAVDPEVIKFIVYDRNFIQVSEMLIGDSGKTAIGKYFLDYTLPSEGTFFVEFYGMITGKPTVERIQINVKRVI